MVSTIAGRSTILPPASPCRNGDTHDGVCCPHDRITTIFDYSENRLNLNGVHEYLNGVHVCNQRMIKDIGTLSTTYTFLPLLFLGRTIMGRPPVGVSLFLLGCLAFRGADCTSCYSGQYVDGSSCKACPANTFQDTYTRKSSWSGRGWFEFSYWWSDSSHTLTSCTDQTTCGQGQMIRKDNLGRSSVYARIDDAITCTSCAWLCSPCPPNTYQLSRSHRATACIQQPKITCGKDQIYKEPETDMIHNESTACAACPYPAFTFQPSDAHNATQCLGPLCQLMVDAKGVEFRIPADNSKCLAMALVEALAFNCYKNLKTSTNWDQCLQFMTIFDSSGVPTPELAKFRVSTQTHMRDDKHTYTRYACGSDDTYYGVDGAVRTNFQEPSFVLSNS